MSELHPADGGPEEHEHEPKQSEGQSIPGNCVEKSSYGASPVIGQDSEHILTIILGYSNEQRRDLEYGGVVLFSDDPSVQNQEE